MHGSTQYKVHQVICNVCTGRLSFPSLHCWIQRLRIRNARMTLVCRYFMPSGHSANGTSPQYKPMIFIDFPYFHRDFMDFPYFGQVKMGVAARLRPSSCTRRVKRLRSRTCGRSPRRESPPRCWTHAEEALRRCFGKTKEGPGEDHRITGGMGP